MRSSTILFFVMLALALAAAPAGAQTQWVAMLRGADEVPPVSSAATGLFEATLSADQTVMTFTLTFQGLEGAATQAHIHRGAAGVNGSVAYVLAAEPFASPLGGQTDPAPAGGPSGFLPADFSELQGGKLYVNLHSTAFPGGEIRGQIVSAVSAQNKTWGRIKALFR